MRFAMFNVITYWIESCAVFGVCSMLLDFAPLWSISPPFCPPIVFESGGGQPLSGTQGKRVATLALVTPVGPEPCPARSTRVNLAALRTVQLLPAFLARLIDKSCAIRMSGGQVSSCQ